MESKKLIKGESKKRLVFLGVMLALFTLATIFLIALPKNEPKREINSSQDSEGEKVANKRELSDIVKNIGTYQVTTLSSTNNTGQCPSYNLSEYQQFFKNYKRDSYFSDYNGSVDTYGEFFISGESLSGADRIFLDKFEKNLNSNNVRELQFTSSCTGSRFSSTVFEKDIQFLDYDSSKLYIVGGQQFVPVTAEQVNLSVLIVAYNSNNEYLIFSTSLNPSNFIDDEDLRGCRIKNNQTPTSYSTTTGDYGFSRTTSDDYDYLELQCVFSESPLKESLESNSESIVRQVLNEYFK